MRETSLKKARNHKKVEDARRSPRWLLVVLWNTIYMDAALTQLRAEGYSVRDEDVARLWSVANSGRCALQQTRSLNCI
jgi:hypothetical protein